MIDKAKMKLKLLKHLKDPNTIKYLIQKLVGDFCKSCKQKAICNPGSALTAYCPDCQKKAYVAWEEYIEEIKIKFKK